MIEKENLSRDELLSDELFLEMMDLESDTEIAKLEIKYTRDAKLMGCKTDFEKMLKAAKAEKKKIQKEKNKVVPFQDNLADGMTHFMGEYLSRAIHPDVSGVQGWPSHRATRWHRRRQAEAEIVDGRRAGLKDYRLTQSF